MFQQYLNLDKINLKKSLPVLVDEKEHCCGCSACYAKCPTKAIEMRADKAGFLYPIIDVEKCIVCHQCRKVCSFKNNQKEKGLY